MRGPCSLLRQLQSGALLLEAIVSIGVFVLFLGGVGLTLMVGERSTVAGGDRVRAAFIAEQALEAVRQMRNVNFTSLTAGQHGVLLSQNAWAFSGTTLTTNDGYRWFVNVTSQGADWLKVESTVGWDFGQSRSGSVVLTTYITNWRKPFVIGNWANMSLIAQLDAAGTPEYQKIAVSGNYAFVTSSRASGGKGLYVFDVTNPASPVAVATSLDLGASAYGLAISGTGLYLATDDPAGELQVLNISSPASLSLSNRIAQANVPGTGKARSIAVYGSNTFVGMLEEPTFREFHSFTMSATGAISLQDSLSMTGGVLDISLHDGYAYAATTRNAGEFLVVDIFDPSDLVFAPGTGIDMDNTQDGAAISTFGTSAIIGRLAGAAIDEVTLYSTAAAPVPVPPPGPWSLDTAGDIETITSVYGGKYAFVGGNGDPNEIRVLNVPLFSSGQPPTVDTHDAPAVVRGLYYNWVNDRLFGVTPTSLLVFAPG